MTDKLLSPLERTKVYEENIKLFFPQLKTSIFEANPMKVTLTVEHVTLHVAGFVFGVNLPESSNQRDLIVCLIGIEQKLNQNGR